MPKPKDSAKLTEKANDNQVAFRLPPPFLELLETRAQIAGLSKGELAKTMVLDALNNESQLNALRERLLALEGLLSMMRKEHALSVDVLLSAAGNYPPDKAKEWVKKNLLTE
jgi:hypothetical protein